MLADLTGTIEDAVVEAGYAGLAAVMAIEVVFPPIPSEIVLPFAGFQVAQGELAFVPALLASTLGAVLGALVLYGIARFGGRALVLRLHPLLRISERDLDRADGWFDRRAVLIVLFGRL
ncbi:MAG TPA: DedA family protein, partial [Solirubrobacteraceae bacterium]|nr:DedA family protein [Solirubrobacteraceae bacterium]